MRVWEYESMKVYPVQTAGIKQGGGWAGCIGLKGAYRNGAAHVAGLWLRAEEHTHTHTHTHTLSLSLSLTASIYGCRTSQVNTAFLKGVSTHLPLQNTPATNGLAMKMCTSLSVTVFIEPQKKRVEGVLDLSFLVLRDRHHESVLS